MWTVRALIYIFSEVCARRTDPVRYSPARCSDALISGALLRCANIATGAIRYVKFDFLESLNFEAATREPRPALKAVEDALSTDRKSKRGCRNLTPPEPSPGLREPAQLPTKVILILTPSFSAAISSWSSSVPCIPLPTYRLGGTSIGM